jgi:hypothetical protein
VVVGGVRIYLENLEGGLNQPYVRLEKRIGRMVMVAHETVMPTR